MAYLHAVARRICVGAAGGAETFATSNDPCLVLIRTVHRHRLAKVLACPRAAAYGEAVRGKLQMAKVLNEAARDCEPAQLMLSPSVRPCPLALADRDRRAELEPRDLTAWFFGDPLPGMSALDRRTRNERAH